MVNTLVEYTERDLHFVIGSLIQIIDQFKTEEFCMFSFAVGQSEVLKLFNPNGIASSSSVTPWTRTTVLYIMAGNCLFKMQLEERSKNIRRSKYEAH